jgi:predicted outer membrane repeat protein
MSKIRVFHILAPCLLAGLIFLGLAAANPAAAGPDAVCEVPSGPYPTIQSAVNDVTCDIIDVAAGTFTENVAVDRTVTIQGQGAGSTIMDGQNSHRLFHIQSSGVVTLTGLTITNGHDALGGGAILNAGMLTVTNSTLSGSSAQFGGGILNWGVLMASNCTLSGNSAEVGGAICHDGTLATVENCSLVDNSASDDGGGIYTEGSPMVVDSSTLSGNQAAQGGAIFAAATVTITNSTLSGNTAVGEGGGLYAYYAFQSSTVVVDNSTFDANTATSGGAIENLGTITITNTTIGHNEATNGGGIHNPPGGPGAVYLANSIVAHNTTGDDCAGTITSLGYNIASDNSCSLTGPGDQPNTDPLLGPLQDNGGPTWTRALVVGSPAVDAGYCPAATTDQRGYPRPVDVPSIPDVADGCDMGAFEFQNEWLVFLPIVRLTP